MRDFRTYTRAEARLGEGLTVVHGPNGAGKSNLLEALYYGCTGRSPRTRKRARAGALRRSGDAGQRAPPGRHGEARAGGRFGAATGGAPAEKRMTADGAPVERLLDVPSRPLVSVFEPDRLELLKGPPALRRAHLDQVVAAVWPARAEVRREYSRVLGQRNALLARIRSGRASRATLATWDRELARRALALREDRAQAVGLLAEPFADRAEAAGVCRRGDLGIPAALARRRRGGVRGRAA